MPRTLAHSHDYVTLVQYFNIRTYIYSSLTFLFISTGRNYKQNFTLYIFALITHRAPPFRTYTIDMIRMDVRISVIAKKTVYIDPDDHTTNYKHLVQTTCSYQSSLVKPSFAKATKLHRVSLRVYSHTINA